MNQFQRYSWLLLVLLSMTPLWLVSLFGRAYWTPDEPREAAIAWRMSVHGDPVLPELGARKFLEKPPLSYWMTRLRSACSGSRLRHRVLTEFAVRAARHRCYRLAGEIRGGFRCWMMAAVDFRIGVRGFIGWPSGSLPMPV